MVYFVIKIYFNHFLIGIPVSEFEKIRYNVFYNLKAL